MSAKVRTLGTRWVFPVEGSPMPDALVAIVDGRIATIRAHQRHSAETDLGNSAILPGFVNAHTHLELSALEPHPADASGVEDEIAWLARVIAQRRGLAEGEPGRRIARNLQEAIASGTTLIADTTTNGLSWPFLAAAPIRSVVFTEILGLKRSRGMETLEKAYGWMGSIRPESQVVACARPGLSPHAPYSTAGWIYERAAASRVPLSTHLAEMPEELELLETRGGRLRGFLEDLGAWEEGWEPISPRPADYVRKGALRQSDWVIAHGTYLDPECFWQLRPESAPADQRVAVAFCPRTHARFGHRPHPYRAILETGGIVCLGTDSLASTPSLSILDEARFLHRSDPSLSGELLLAMATLFGAWALRAEMVTGSLKPGKSADLAVVPLPDREASDPHDLVLNSDAPVLATMFEGKFVGGFSRAGWATS